MLAPVHHVDEAARLEALARLRLLDGGDEERFDRLVRLAVAMFQAPMGMISLVDEHRQWYKSRLGLHEPAVARHLSFCAHAINEPSGRLVVEDATKDARFADHPFVTGEQHLRSYAGYVLHDPSGLPLGTIAVADRMTRRFTEDELATLADLAAIAEREIASTADVDALRRIERVEQRKRLAMEALTEGFVFQAPSGEILEWNAAAERVLGLDADELAGRSSIDSRWRCVREDGTDWPGDTHPAMQAMATGDPVHDAVMGVHRPSGDLVWLRVNARPLVDDDGLLLGAFTAFQDITTELEVERRNVALAERLTAAIEAGGIGTALLDGSGRITFANQALASILDAARRELDGAPLTHWFQQSDPVHRQMDELLAGTRHQISADVCLAPLDDSTSSLLASGLTAPDARWIRLNLNRLPGIAGDEATMIAQVTDITLRRHLEADLARSEELARVSLDVLEQGVVFVSPTLGTLRVNPAAVRLLGIAPEDDYSMALTSHDWALLDDSLRLIPPEENPVNVALESGEPVRDQVLWLRRFDGAYLRVRMSVMPFGWTDEVVIAFSDITAYTRLGQPRPEQVHAGTV
ncbi:MAG: PAS domain-containing protein [Acidimicrobiales bacterium]